MTTSPRWSDVMRVANYEGRLAVVTGGAGHDLAYDVEGIGEMRHRFVAASPVRKEN